MNQPVSHFAKADDPALFIKGVSTLDCAIFDPASGVFGQSWHVDVELRGKLDEQGFVYDFSKLKKLIRQVLKDSVDHALIIPVMSKGIDFREDEQGEHWRMHARCKMTDTDHIWEYFCPKGSVFPMRSVSIKADAVEQELARQLRHRLPTSISDVKIMLREEAAEPTEAFFRYTHGIKGHEGLCQRLFHGHRSRIEVFVGEERRADLEHYVTRELFGSSVHIASSDQIKSGPVELGMRGKPGNIVEINYQAAFGEFKAMIPSDNVFVVEGETSIESIARQLAAIIKAEEKINAPVRVFAYEGINKGSIAIK